MNIAVIGHGHVGGALGRRWETLGHAVLYGVRDPNAESVRAFHAEHGGNPLIASIPGAIARSEAVLLATPFPAALEIASANAVALAGRIVIDATNPIGPGLVLSVGHTSSGAEQIHARAPGARVVKAFNTYGWENFADSMYPGGRAAMFIAGDEASARARVAELADAMGFRAVVVGDLKMARYLEPLAMLWIQLGRVQGKGSGFAWSMLER